MISILTFIIGFLLGFLVAVVFLIEQVRERFVFTKGGTDGKQ